MDASFSTCCRLSKHPTSLRGKDRSGESFSRLRVQTQWLFWGLLFFFLFFFLKSAGCQRGGCCGRSGGRLFLERSGPSGASQWPCVPRPAELPPHESGDLCACSALQRPAGRRVMKFTELLYEAFLYSGPLNCFRKLETSQMEKHLKASPDLLGGTMAWFSVVNQLLLWQIRQVGSLVYPQKRDGYRELFLKCKDNKIKRIKSLDFSWSTSQVFAGCKN